MTQLRINVDRTGISLYDTPFSDTNFEVVLVANVVQSVSVPSDAVYAWISSTGDFFASTETFLLPTSNTFVSSVSQLNPPNPKNVKDITTLFFRSAISQTITVAFYTP